MKTILIILLLPVLLSAQSPAQVVVTAFPSLQIPASSRGLGMGDAGIASATENQQLYYNVAKTAFTQNFHQASVTYMPWLTGISNDTKFMNVNYLANISNNSAFGVALTYLNLGEISLRDDNGATLANYHASEYNLMGCYALQIGAKASLGVSFHVLGQNAFITAPKNSYSVCGDISYYQYKELGDASKILSWGAVVSSLGPKVNTASGHAPLPANIGLGIAFKNIDAGSNDQYGFSFDAKRLIADDWNGLRFSGGAEYGFAGQFFLRGGVNYENSEKGNRKYFALGAGYKGFLSDQSWGLDFHYLIPFGTAAAVSPFQNAWGFTLSLSFGNFQ
jgi:hypothetical protein